MTAKLRSSLDSPSRIGEGTDRQTQCQECATMVSSVEILGHIIKRIAQKIKKEKIKENKKIEVIFWHWFMLLLN